MVRRKRKKRREKSRRLHTARNWQPLILVADSTSEYERAKIRKIENKLKQKR